MESKLIWQPPFKMKDSVSEYFETITPIGKIKIQFVNASNLSTESFLPGNPGQNHKVFNVGILFEKFPENNITFSETEINICFSIVESWYQQKYEQLRNVFNPNPVASSAQLIHEVFVNKYCNIAKEHVGEVPKNIPGCVKVHEALEVLEEIFPETKFKD